MSTADKYRQRGAYHYAEFAQKTTYRDHVIDLVEQIVRHAPEGASILDVGAGEGLVMEKLFERGFNCWGCDNDPVAVKLAHEHGNKVILATIHDLHIELDDVVLLSDSLEHMEDPDGVIEEAKRRAPIVVIAIPSEKDRHAVRQMQPSDVKELFEDWELVHSATRHARHLLIFKRKQIEETVPALDDEEVFSL